MTTVEDDVKLFGLLHLFQKRFGVLGVCDELSDLQPDVVSRRSFNELLQTDETCRETDRSKQTVYCQRHKIIQSFLIKFTKIINRLFYHSLYTFQQLHSRLFLFS